MKRTKKEIKYMFLKLLYLEKRICRYFRKAFVAYIPFSNLIGFDIPQFRII